MRLHRQISGNHPVSYMAQLDGLRALAISMVLWNKWVPGALSTHVPLGTTGVYLFFVVSGFLITRILLRARGRPLGSALKTFYSRRVLRIFPAYYLIVAVFTVLAAPGLRENLFWNLTYTTNLRVFWTREWVGASSPFWSLAIEEQFYLFWPLLILSLPERWLRPAILAAVASAPLARGALFALGFQITSVQTLTVCAFDTLGMGALLALAWERGRLQEIKRYLRWTGWATLLLFLAVCMFGPPHRSSDKVAAVLACLVPYFGAQVVLLCATGGTGVFARVLSSGPFAYLGRISYGVYLLYGFIPLLIEWLRSVAPGPFLVPGVVPVTAVAINISLAAAMYEFFERPILSLKDKVPYDSSQRPAASDRDVPRLEV